MENIYINETILKVFPNGEIWKFGFKAGKSKEQTWYLLKDNIHTNQNGYKIKRIWIGKNYTTSRLLAYAFLRFDLEDEEDTVDHINRNSLDNHISNLRCASRIEQTLNTSTVINAKGYYWDKSKQRYIVRIKVNCKTIILGRYKLEEDAKKAYQDAVKKFR